jgi:glucosamine-6-phosphate deaminase
MNLLRFDSGSAWASGVATFWRDRLRTNARLRMCLPSGLTPNPVYAEMVRSAAAGDATFARATVFVLDEFGGVPPDDPGRAKHAIVRHLIGSVDLPADAFHALDTDAADIDAECRRYDLEIGGGFDLVLLGIGLNGHLGMNEPGSPPHSRTRKVELHDTTIASSARYFTHQDVPRWGVTVGLQPILAAREVWLLASGRAKAAIAQRVVSGEIDESVPASLLRGHANCSLFVDAEAGALL